MKAEKLADLRAYPVKPRQAIVQLLKSCHSCLFWTKFDYEPDIKESEHSARVKKFLKENQANWKIMEALVGNKDKVEAVLHFEPSEYSELPMGTFSLLIEPSSKRAKAGPSQKKLVHWSDDLSKRGIKSLQTINHKFAIWKSIMCEESVYG